MSLAARYDDRPDHDARKIVHRAGIAFPLEWSKSSRLLRRPSDGPDHGWRRDRFAYERGRPQLLSVEITAHRVAVEARPLELAHDHADVLLAEVLSPVPRNRNHNPGFVAEAPMARCLAAEFGKAVID